MEPVSHVVETSLYVAELAAARGFYVRVLDFAVIFEDERMCALAVPGRCVLLLFRHGGSVVASETPSGTIPPHDGAGALHVCFGIPAAALEDWAARLEREGVAVESRVKWPAGGVSLYFRDVDGHSVELATPGLWPAY
jgi:catechol 2,3-dioxygenase-like lactoylglutathione lyase family enzyme